MSQVRIALAQIDATVGDLPGNSARIGTCIEEARERGADLVVFPQMTLSGYPPGDLLTRTAFLDASERALQELIPQSAGLTVILGCVANRNGVLNAAVVLRDGELAGIQGKGRLSTLPYLDERRYFQPDQLEDLYQVAGQRVGITIGDEIGGAGERVGRLVSAGADLIVNLASAPFQWGLAEARERELRACAMEHQVAIAFVNRVGGQDELVFGGESMLVSASGEVLARARPLREEILVADLMPELRAGAHLAPAVVRDELADTYQALTIGIGDYARKNGFDHVVLGLSGGLDSALVATLAVDALGADAVTGVWMPSRYSSELSRNDAVALAEALGMELITIPIEEPFGTYLDLLEPHFAGRGPDLTEENLQARIRGNLLMALSNKFGWLVLVTSNKSEAAVGYSTLYGDMAGGFAPLKDVPKTLVVELARWRNRQAPVIPASTIERPPTAELRAEQLDSDSLPAYDVLDPILERYLVDRWSAAQIIASGFDQATVERVLRLVDNAEYKRRQAPPGIKITPYTFGVDDQMPLTSRFREV